MQFARASLIALALSCLSLLCVCAEAQAQMRPSAPEVALAEESLRLRMTRDLLLSRNRRWQVPAVGIGVGVASIVVGAVVFISSQHVGDPLSSCGSCSDGDFDKAPFGVGVGLLTLGSLLVVVGLPMFAVRLGRELRLRTLERRLGYLATSISLVPQVKPSEHVGLAATFRF